MSDFIHITGTEEIGYTIVFEDPQPYRIGYTVYPFAKQDNLILYNPRGGQGCEYNTEDLRNAKPMLQGALKSDGCMDWTLVGNSIHTCGRSGMNLFTDLVQIIYEKGMRHIPNASDE